MLVERSGAPAERSRNLGGPWAERVERRLDEIRSAGRWRRYRDLDAHGPRGVLIRPLGDVVVLMPPLTTTAEEIDRIVDALVASIGDLT